MSLLFGCKIGRNNRALRLFILTFVSFLIAALTLPACQDMAIKHYNDGLDAFEAGDTTAAIEFFRKSIEQRHDDPDPHINLGCALFAAEQYDEALEALSMARRIDPENYHAMYSLARLYALTGETDLSLEHLSMAVNSGYSDYKFVSTSDDLASIRDDPRFERLLTILKNRSGAGE